MDGPYSASCWTKVVEIIPHVQVLARSSPKDKKLLVEKLHVHGEIVSITGNDPV